MRHVFILNPAAGKGSPALKLLPEIQRYFSAHPAEYSLRITDHPGHATEIARQEALARQDEDGGEPVRLYACGGDGTLLETATGMRGQAHMELACIPCGSANDLLRSLPQRERFADLEAMVGGRVKRMDAIVCNGKLSLNLASMGMDADVASKMTDYKHLPLVSGPMAYQLAIVYTFFHPIGRQLRVEMDTPEGLVVREGRFLFALAANGQYYGGGYRGAPEARPDDGLLDFILVDAVKRAKIPGFMSRYKKGQHLHMDICQHFKGTRMRVTAPEPTVVNLDGECSRETDVTFQLLPGAIPFVMPSGEA